MVTPKEFERRIGFAMQEAAKAWQGEKTSKRVMDAELAEEFAKILVVHMYEPKLGCASTRELIEEIKVRIEVDGNLDYKTVPDDGPR